MSKPTATLTARFVLLALAVCTTVAAVAACTASSQRGTKPLGGLTTTGTGSGTGNSTSSGTTTGTSTNGSASDEQADEAAEVAGAFLTCDYSGEDSANEDESDIGCAVKAKDGTTLDVASAALTASLDRGDGQAATALPVTASGGWHFTFLVAHVDMPKSVVTARVALGLVGAVDLTFALSELAGDTLTALRVEGYFDFPNMELTMPLSGTNYCKASGIRDAVQKTQPNPVGNPTILPIAAFGTSPANLPLPTDAAEPCFEPLASYVGTEAGDILAPSDVSGRLVGQFADGANAVSCFFAVARLVGDVGPSKALLVIDPKKVDGGDLKRTTAAHACAN